MTETYKNRFLRPRVFELLDGSGWTAEVLVAEDDGSDTIDSRFILRGKFNTEESAYCAALEAGRAAVEQKIKDRDLQQVMEEATMLPSTPRSAYGTWSDDLAEGKDGNRRGVPSSGNPKSRF